MPGLGAAMKTIKHAIVALLLVLGSAATAWAQFEAAPVCYAGFVGDLRKAIGPVSDANDFFRMVKSYGEDALKGTADVLKYKGGDKFYETFTTFAFLKQNGHMPFADDEEIFEVIGKLAKQPGGGGADGFPGIKSLVGNITGNEENAQGAVFSLFIGREAADNGTNYGKLSGFELSDPVPGTTRVRQYDVILQDGMKYENKAWSSVPTSGRVFTDFLDEVYRDILIHGPSNFEKLRYNILLPPGVDPNDLDDLLPHLLDLFDDPVVLERFLNDEDLVEEAMENFMNAWLERRLVKVYAPAP